MALWLYIKAVDKHWWALMSCALFTLLGVYILRENETAQRAINATFVLAGFCLLVACFLAWYDEHKRATKSETEKDAIHKMHDDQCPVLGFNVISNEGMKIWMETNIPVDFSLQHLSGRVATSVRFDPILSRLGKYSLQFDALAFVDPPVRKMMRYEIQEVGQPVLGPEARIKIGIIEHELLRLFVLDSPEEDNEWEYVLRTHFRDGDKERSQTFHLRFERSRFRFLRNTAH